MSSLPPLGRACAEVDALLASLHGLRLTFLYNGASAEHAIATLKQTSSDRGVAQQRNELRPCVHPRSQPAARRVRPLRTPGPLHTGDRGLPLPANARSIQDLTRPPHPLVMGAGSRTSARPPPDLTEKPRRLPPPKRGDAQPQAPERRELLDEERPPAHVRLAKAARYVHGDAGEALPTHSFPRLILPLLAVSGRHFGELVNGRSTFAPPPLYFVQRPAQKAWHAALVPNPAARAVTDIRKAPPPRQKQNGKVSPPDKRPSHSQELAKRPTRARSGRPPKRSHHRSHRRPRAGLPVGVKYVVAVCQLFISPVSTLPRVAMKVLGHDT